MNSFLFRLILATTFVLGASSLRNAAAQDTIELQGAKFITLQKDKDKDRDNIERYRVDLSAIDNDQVVELTATRDKSFTIVTSSTNYVTGRFDEFTNLNFVDASTNFVAKIAIPKNGRDMRFYNAPAVTNTNVNSTTR